MKLAIVVPPYETIGQASPNSSHREMSRADDLAQAMRSALTIDVPVLEAPLASAPATGYLFVFQTVPWVVDAALARRIIAFDQDRSSIMKNVEQYGFAGAVEKHRYFQWCSQRDRERGYGLVGKKAVATRMSARLPGLPFTSPNYGVMESATARNLPELIAEYLKAYDAAP